MSSSPDLVNLYRQMMRIRRFEEAVLAAFPRGLIYGTTHTSIGQEADAVGVLASLDEGDVVVSNHRGHGHFLAYGGPMDGLAAELMGKASGICGGRGGSQHLHWSDFYANGILGGTLPLATGMALAERASGRTRVVFAFTGDGALGEGAVYESLNMASLWRLPLLVVLENNRYAQTTPVHLNLAGSIQGRFQAFGIPAVERDTTDVLEIFAAARDLVGEVRRGIGPRALVIDTYRFAPHSKGDDTRDPAEIERYRLADPILVHGRRLDREVREMVEAEVEAEVGEAFRRAEAAPSAAPETLTPALGPVK